MPDDPSYTATSDAEAGDAFRSLQGTGEPGRPLEVEITQHEWGTTSGGTTTHTVVVGEDGSWSLDLGEVGDGHYTIKVQDIEGVEPPVTFDWHIWIDPDARALQQILYSTPAPATGPPPQPPPPPTPMPAGDYQITVGPGAAETDVFQTVGGTGEPGSQLTVTVQTEEWGTSSASSTEHTVTVGEDGTWTLDLGELEDGKYTISVQDPQGLFAPVKIETKIWVDPDTRRNQRDDRKRPPDAGPQSSLLNKAVVGAGVVAIGIGASIGAFFLFTGDGEPVRTTSPSGGVVADEATEDTATDPALVVDKPVGGEVAMGLPGEPAGLNPLLSSGIDPNLTEIENALWTGVYDIDGFTLELIPDVVTELPSIANGGITINDDGTETVRYQIRDEAVWADGTPISGDDFLFTYQTITDPDLPIDKTIYEDIDPESVVAGPNTFEFTLTQPTIQAELIFGSILPKHDVEGSDFVNDWNDTMWVSGGPFIFDTWQKGEFIRLVRNDNFWKTDQETGQQLPYLDSVVFRFIPETASLINAFKAREVDVINPPPSIETIEDLQALEAEGATVEVLSGPIWEHLNFQFGDGRLARNPNSYNEFLEYRQAVAHAIDKQKIVDEILKGQVEPLDSYVDAFSPTLSTGAWAQYDYDPDKALALVDDLCARPDTDCDANPVKAIFSSTSNNDARVTLSQLFIQMFEDAGMEYEAQLEDSSLFFGETLDFGGWDLGEWAWVGTPGLAGLVSIHDVFDPEAPPPDGSNFYRWGTPEVAPTADPLVSAGPELDPLSGLYTFGETELSDPNGHLLFVGELPGGAEYRIYKDGTIEINGLHVPLRGTIGEDGSYTAMGTGSAAGRSGVVAEATGTVTSTGMTITYRLGTQGALPGSSIDWDAVGILSSPLTIPGPFDPSAATSVAQSFLEGFTIWIQFGGESYGSFLNDSLDPRHIEFYGAEACANTTNGLAGDPTFRVEVTGEASGPEPFFFGDPGPGVIIPDAFSIPVEITQQGVTSDQIIHLSIDPEGNAGWFTPCANEPIALPPVAPALAPYLQGPSSVIDESTARFAEVRDQMNATVEEPVLIPLIQEAENLLADDAVFLPLYPHPSTGAAWTDKLGGWKHNPTTAGATWNIQDWFLFEPGVAEDAGQVEDVEAIDTIEGPSPGLFDELNDLAGEQGLQGQVIFITPGPSGDVVGCNTGEPSDALGADITGLVATQQGNTVTAAVPMAQSPLLSDEDFSWAVLLQAITASNQGRTLIWEIHDGERKIGEQDDLGDIDPTSEADVSINEKAVLYTFTVDPADPLAVLFAQGFNSPVAGDETGCDGTAAAADPFPPASTDVSGDCTADATTACVQNQRYAVQVQGEGGALLTDPALQGSDGVSFLGTDFEMLIRVLNGCSFNDHFWVFAAAATDVELDLNVEDTATGELFRTPLGGASPAITDTSAFATCP